MFQHFDDPDGDPLTYAASSSSPAHASVSVSGSVVTVRGVLIGAATVTVTASDPEGLTARQRFAVKILNPDRRVLGVLHDALGGDGWTEDTNWMTEAPLDEWYGVTTNETGRVVRLDLGENGLAGQIPAEVGRLRFLERLDLAWNRVDESPPQSVGETGRLDGAGFPRDAHEGLGGGEVRGDPDWRSTDASLPPSTDGIRTPKGPGRSMSLRSDGITGPIPRELATLSNLKELWLAGNSLTGAIPPELENLSNLESLWLRSNSLRGQIPRGIGSLTALEWLSLDHNQLTGKIPSELGRLAKLEYLDLDFNQLTGQVPREIGSLARLGHLTLDHNQLTGEIPSELGRLDNLEELHLADNRLSSHIPPEIGNLSNLRVLWLSRNRLVGKIPEELGRLADIEGLWLNSNGLSGPIPSALGRLTSIKYLGLQQNRLTGPVPEEFGRLRSLKELGLYGNGSLAGSLPAEFVHLPLTWFHWYDTGLCAPSAKAFQDWLRSIKSHRGGRACPAPTFDLDIGFTSNVSSTVRSHLTKARDRWEAALGPTELANVTFNREVSCGGLTGYVGTVDDHLFWAHVDSIDGKGGTLAYARYCYARSDESPVISRAVFDEADLERMLDHGALVPVAFHEMAHGLGFSRYHWDKFDLVDKTSDPHFSGDLAIDAFDDAGGDDYDGEKVPVQLQVYSHWREDVFRDEMMTPSINVRDDEAPVSVVTLQSMADIGYEVDLSWADDYELPDPTAPPPEAPGDEDRTVFDLGNDVEWGPVIVVDAGGRVIRVIPPPPGSVHRPLARGEVRIESRLPPRSGNTPPSYTLGSHSKRR